MKIQAFKKQRNGQYKILLEDNQELLIYEDTILKYNLLLHKTITEELLKKIEVDNNKQETYYQALKHLQQRRRSSNEVRQYLLKKEYLKENIEEAINNLIKQGYLNDLSYASSFVHEQLMITSNGPEKIKAQLLKKGVEQDYINQALEQFTNDIMNTKIEKIITKLIKSNHNKSNIILKRKITSYLINQGYPNYLIQKHLSQTKLDNDSDIRKKEYDKLYKKLQRKYTGKELEYKIKQKMYQKGFTYEEE